MAQKIGGTENWFRSFTESHNQVGKLRLLSPTSMLCSLVCSSANIQCSCTGMSFQVALSGVTDSLGTVGGWLGALWCNMCCCCYWAYKKVANSYFLFWFLVRIRIESMREKIFVFGFSCLLIFICSTVSFIVFLVNKLKVRKCWCILLVTRFF